jgi:hypothetical protein
MLISDNMAGGKAKAFRLRVWGRIDQVSSLHAMGGMETSDQTWLSDPPQKPRLQPWG